MLKDMMQRLGASAAAVILAAFAGGVTFIALAFAIFAALEQYVSTAAAAGLTALVFAIVSAALALLFPRVAPKKHEIVAVRPKLDPAAMRLATEVGVAILGIAGDVALSRRLKREEKIIKTSRKR